MKPAELHKEVVKLTAAIAGMRKQFEKPDNNNWMTSVALKKALEQRAVKIGILRQHIKLVSSR